MLLTLEGHRDLLNATIDDVVRAIDEGQTEHKVRLLGIDAPEIGQPFGTVSRDRLTALTKGKSVEVSFYERDRYGRVLARLEVGGLDVNQQMVTDGLAWRPPIPRPAPPSGACGVIPSGSRLGTGGRGRRRRASDGRR